MLLLQCCMAALLDAAPGVVSRNKWQTCVSSGLLRASRRRHQAAPTPALARRLRYLATRPPPGCRPSAGLRPATTESQRKVTRCQRQHDAPAPAAPAPAPAAAPTPGGPVAGTTQLQCWRELMMRQRRQCCSCSCLPVQGRGLGPRHNVIQTHYVQTTLPRRHPRRGRAAVNLPTL